MKIYTKIIGSVLGIALTGLTSCGLYTNIPAQIKVSSVTEGASVSYTVSANAVAAEVKNPKISLEGEAGSIGVTYDTITIEYLPTSLSLNPRKFDLAGSVRVPSSHQVDENGLITKGKGEYTVPVISSQIIQLGNPLSQNRVNSQLSAKITLSGTDDAGFPSSIDIYVPINFITNSLPTG